MFHIKSIMEEIHYYENRNKELEIENLLLKVMEQKTINEKKIEDNKKRIEKLWWAIMEVI